MALAAKLDEPDILDSSFCCQQPFPNKSSNLVLFLQHFLR